MVCIGQRAKGEASKKIERDVLRQETDDADERNDRTMDFLQATFLNSLLCLLQSVSQSRISISGVKSIVPLDYIYTELKVHIRREKPTSTRRDLNSS